jgi:chemotaxis protein MotB
MGGRKRHGGEEEESSERWLLTYADMITLLMALFMVLFSISSVNISKYKTLQKALKDAFSGQILPGGKALEQTGSTSTKSTSPNPTAATSVLPFSLEPSNPLRHAVPMDQSAAQQEQESFQHLKHEIESYAANHGLSSYVKVTVQQRGLVIRLLTDKLLFPSGQATLTAASYPLLEKISSLIALDQEHPIAVEGNTDAVPIHTGQYPSNWELSAARASSIVEFLVAHGIAPHRLSEIGYAEQDPIATNTTPGGRALNRRVEIVLERLYSEPGASGESTGSTDSAESTGSAESAESTEASNPEEPSEG